MRLYLFALFAAMAPASAASADPPSAQAALVERSGLLQLDTRCRLLTANVRSAVQAGAVQARGALLRGGWTPARVDQLERTVAEAARNRACDDPRTQSAVLEARESFTSWASVSVMEFPGLQRAWTARRTVGPNGWRLSQAVQPPAAIMFGVREIDDRQQLSLALADPRGAPAGARMVMRDAARSRPGALDLTRRIAYGLEAGAPEPGVRSLSFEGARRVERRAGASHVVFVFSDAAFAAMLALDPRESVEIRLGGGRVTQRLFVEVGDIAAARAFLSLRAD